MTRLLLAVALATLLNVSLPAAAHAGWQVKRAQQIAAAVWDDPCDGNVQATWGSFPAEYELSRWTVAIALTDDADYCEVRFNPMMRLTFRLRCTVMIHEYARFAGYLDEDPNDPTLSGSVMATGTRDRRGHGDKDWIYDAPDATDPRCVHRGRDFLGLGQLRNGRGTGVA